MEEGEEFFASRWPEAGAVADPELWLYRAFGIDRGKAKEVIGLPAVGAAFRALLKGNGIGKPVGDPWIMPGVFLACDLRLVFRQRIRHSGDRTDVRSLAKMARVCSQADP